MTRGWFYIDKIISKHLLNNLLTSIPWNLHSITLGNNYSYLGDDLQQIVSVLSVVKGRGLPQLEMTN